MKRWIVILAVAIGAMTTASAQVGLLLNSSELILFNAPGGSAPAWSIQRNGGNQRGLHAVDLQSSRSDNAQVASGNWSVVSGGTDNTASGTVSVVSGGTLNTASGLASVVSGGTNNAASGDYSAIAGGFNLRVGDRSFGFSGQVTGATTDLSGSSNIAAFVDVDLWLYNVRNQAGQLRLYEPSNNGTNYTAFQAPAQGSDIIYTLPATAGSAGQVLSIASVSGTGVTLQWSSAGGGSGWLLTGNSGTDPNTNFLGTTDNQPLAIRVNNQETFRFNAPGTSAPAWSIQRGGGNTRGLHAVDLQSDRTAATQVASGNYSVVSGGSTNTASGYASVVSGGGSNTASGITSVVSGGGSNTASGAWCVVSGGIGNTASGDGSVVSGGLTNTASGIASVVSGGLTNTASGDYSAIAGGFNLRVGNRSFGFSGQTSTTQTNLSSSSNIAAFVDVDLWLYNVRNQAGQLRLYEPSNNGTNYTAFRAQTQTSDIVYTLPASVTAGGVLQTDGSGNLSWANPSTLVSSNETDPQVGTLSTGQVAFWDGSALTGSNNLFWDNTNARLGVGTTTPWQGLHLHNTGLQLTNGSTGNSSTDGLTIEFNGSNAQLRLKENAEIQFRTNAPGTTDSVKMRLTATGQLLFFDPSNGAQYRIDLPNSNSLGVGYIRARGLSSYSSRAWKEDIRPIAGALEKVLALRGVEYRWKPAYGGNQDLGFIAEEVDAVLPEVVQKSQSGEYLGMDYMRIVPVVVEALKEEHRRNEELRARVEEQNRRNEELRAELAQLRTMIEQLAAGQPITAGAATTTVRLDGQWLGQNIPNPHDGTTTIPYYVPAGVGRAQLEVSDAAGRTVRTIELPAREQWASVTLEMGLLSSGTYEYRLLFDGRIVATKQMQLVK